MPLVLVTDDMLERIGWIGNMLKDEGDVDSPAYIAVVYRAHRAMELGGA